MQKVSNPTPIIDLKISMDRKQEWFTITSVHRLDLIGLGFDGDAVDDATMEHLTHLINRDFCVTKIRRNIL